MPKLVCGTCGDEKEVPKCCGGTMKLKEGLKLVCNTCKKEIPIPTCCGGPMEYWE